MNAQLILPNTFLETELPVIFLAGPITSAPNWQETAIKYLLSNKSDIVVASPRRQTREGKPLDFTDEMFDEQVDWETYYLNKAAKNGTILFWLAKEAIPHPQRSYAQTTRFELAEWKTKYQQQKFNLCLGIENGFTGAKYIKRRFAQDCPEIVIFDNLEKLLEAV